MLSWQLPNRSTHQTSPAIEPSSRTSGSDTRPGTRPAGIDRRAQLGRAARRRRDGRPRAPARHDRRRSDRARGGGSRGCRATPPTGRRPPSPPPGASRPLSGPSSTPPATSTPTRRRSVPTPGSTTATHDAVVGEVLHRAHEQQRAGAHVVRRDVVADVEDPDVGREPEHHGLADADELVGEAVVGRERDEHAVTLRAARRSPSARRPRSGRFSRPACSGIPRYVSTSTSRTRNDRPDPHCGQFARFDDAIDRHGRHSHEIGDFLNCQESRRGE